MPSCKMDNQMLHAYDSDATGFAKNIRICAMPKIFGKILMLERFVDSQQDIS